MSVPSGELWSWGAAPIAKAIRSGAISAKDVATSCLARIATTNHALNALVEIDPEDVLRQAEAADRAVFSRSPLGPLHGVPVSTKVNTDETGKATTHGLTELRDNVATTDAPVVANLRAAGAIMAGRSNCPPFSSRWFTSCDVHGRTLNPWNTHMTPGGSSGGAAAAVAAGMVPIAQGNDIGGSIRQPAYHCGVVGIRPTVGRVPNWFTMPGGPEALSSQLMLVQGPIARSVDDLRLALEVMSAPDSRDPLHCPSPLPSRRLMPAAKVALVRSVGIADPEGVVDRALDQAAAMLCDAGHSVIEIELPALADAYRLWYLLAVQDMKLGLKEIEQLGDAAIKQAVTYYLAIATELWGETPTLADVLNGYARRTSLMAELNLVFRDYAAIILPVSARHAIRQDADLESFEATRGLAAAQWPLMAIPALGFPAMSVPMGLHDGMPTGVQILGPRFAEDLIMDVGEILEARVGALTPIMPSFP